LNSAAGQIEVVVLGASPTGLYALREAAGAGYRVAVADTGPGCALHSRHVRGADRYFIGSLEEVERWLMRIAEQGGERPILLPTNDIFIEYIVRRNEILAPHFYLPSVYAGLAAKLLNKRRFHDLCKQRGVATPGVWGVDKSRALLALVDAVPFPCLLKPTLIHRARGFLKGRKVVIARTREDFVERVAAMPDDLGGWIVQEIIPGPESAITLFGGYVDTSGQARQVFSARKLRQYPPGFGSASLVSSERCPETEDKTLAFLKKIGFQGVCGAEFKRDPRDGVLKIIEINPRPTLWFQISHDSCKQIVAALIADLLHGEVLDEHPQDTDVLWRYALKDIFSALVYLRDSRGFVLPRPDVRPGAPVRRRSWPVFASNDLRPALYEPFGYLRKLGGRLR
jgi:predicted ATP-grasp superfamily ATP-dependent carboligase